MKESEFWEKTRAVVPDGVQTLSKMPSKHVQGVYPIYLDKAEGAYVWDKQGKKYIDYPLGLGPIILGHNHSAVTNAITHQLDQATLLSLPHRLETQLAEKMCQLIPCAEMVRFLKTGSEAVSAAIKIARAYTGREGIVFCGYGGWHDTYSATTPKKAGIPKVYSSLAAQAKYNDLESFKRLFSLTGAVQKEIAAVVIEPYVLEEPQDDFLKNLVEFAHRQGALIVFDEIVTGFRTLEFSAQKYFKITPDLACFSKAMANGLPISCVCGKREIMKVLERDCFVSSTFGGELLSIAAALATIETLEVENGQEHIWKIGQRLKNSFNKLAKENKIDFGAKCEGYPCRTYFRFENEAQKSLFWQECLKQGILFGYAQFISLSHKKAELDKTIDAMGKAMRIVAKYWDEPTLVLEGPAAQETFRLISTK